MSSYVNCLGGRCPHMPFFIGGHMSGGGNVLHSPQGWDFGALGVPGGLYFFQTWSCGISNQRG